MWYEGLIYVGFIHTKQKGYDVYHHPNIGQIYFADTDDKSEPTPYEEVANAFLIEGDNTFIHQLTLILNRIGGE